MRAELEGQDEKVPASLLSSKLRSLPVSFLFWHSQPQCSDTPKTKQSNFLRL